MDVYAHFFFFSPIYKGLKKSFSEEKGLFFKEYHSCRVPRVRKDVILVFKDSHSTAQCLQPSQVQPPCSLFFANSCISSSFLPLVSVLPETTLLTISSSDQFQLGLFLPSKNQPNSSPLSFKMLLLQVLPYPSCPCPTSPSRYLRCVTSCPCSVHHFLASSLGKQLAHL